jgi:3-deoxy-manno-octulosonate cytidylyltransferase (CMP-KDO synthetase)
MTSAGRTPRAVAIIPARYASHRLPGKPLADIAGLPMIVHVMRRTAAASLINDVIVATDDDRIADAVRKHGGTAVMTSADIRSGTDRVARVAATLDGYDIIVNVQGDEPLIPPAMIDQAVRPLIDDRTIEAGTLVRRIARPADLESPNVVKVVLDTTGRCLYFSRSPIPYGRDLPVAELLSRYPVYAHIGLYVFRREFLLQYAELPPTPLERAENLEQLRILEHGHALHATVTRHESIAVDTAEDLERVRSMMG